MLLKVFLNSLFFVGMKNMDIEFVNSLHSKIDNTIYKMANTVGIDIDPTYPRSRWKTMYSISIIIGCILASCSYGYNLGIGFICAVYSALIESIIGCFIARKGTETSKLIVDHLKKHINDYSPEKMNEVVIRSFDVKGYERLYKSYFKVKLLLAIVSTALIYFSVILL